MDAPLGGAAWLIEICPASTLKREGRYSPYKGRGDGLRERRAALLGAFQSGGELAPVRDGIVRTLLDDAEGDALDAVIAAIGARRALLDPALFTDRHDPDYRLEGRVYA